MLIFLDGHCRMKLVISGGSFDNLRGKPEAQKNLLLYLSNQSLTDADAYKAFTDFTHPPLSSQTRGKITFQNIVESFKKACREASYANKDIEGYIVDESSFQLDAFQKALKVIVSQADAPDQINRNAVFASLKGGPTFQNNLFSWLLTAKVILDGLRKNASQNIRKPIDPASASSSSLRGLPPSSSPSHSSTSSPNRAARSTDIQSLFDRADPFELPNDTSHSPARAKNVNVFGDLDDAHKKMIGNMFLKFYKREIKTSKVNPIYIDFHNVWEPQNSYEAIIQDKEHQKSRLLHHFRVCLEILHLIYFRLNDDLKPFIYDDKLEKQCVAFVQNIPLIIYAGWDMQDLFNVPADTYFGVDVKPIKLLNLRDSYSQDRQSYNKYYSYIDNVFSSEQTVSNERGSKDLDKNVVDTLLEVLCMVFSVNYKKYVYNEQGINLNRSDRYNDEKISTTIPAAFDKLRVQQHGGTKGKNTYANGIPVRTAYLNANQESKPKPSQVFVPRGDTSQLLPVQAMRFSRKGQSVDKKDVIRVKPCYISKDNVGDLRDIYENHCILIVTTLLMLDVDSFQVRPPPYPPQTRKRANLDG